MRSLSDVLSDTSFPVWFTHVLDCIADARGVGEFQSLLEEITERLGAEHSLFASISGEPADRAHVFVLGRDPSWWHRHRAAVAPRDDPWLLYAIERSTPVLASTLGSQAAANRHGLVNGLASGFTSCVLIPAHSAPSENRTGVLCLGHTSPAYFDDPALPRLVARASGLAIELHRWWCVHDRARLAALVRLSSSDLELLDLHCAGLGSKQIAEAVHASPEAINSRFHRMIVRLGVRNRRVAARLALDCGLIRTYPRQ